MFKYKLLQGIALLVLMSCGVHSALAQTLEGPVVLTLSGKITHTNSDQTMQFDRAMLEALPQVKVVTQTPWFDDVSEFEGPLASAVLEAAGADFSR